MTSYPLQPLTLDLRLIHFDTLQTSDSDSRKRVWARLAVWVWVWPNRHDDYVGDVTLGWAIYLPSVCLTLRPRCI